MQVGGIPFVDQVLEGIHNVKAIANNHSGRIHIFHNFGNGAQLERLNFLGDRSEKGMQQSYGLMVNYLYALDKIEANHEAYAEKGQIASSSAIRKMLPVRAAAETSASA